MPGYATYDLRTASSLQARSKSLGFSKSSRISYEIKYL
jgi:hypothetical protein